MPLYDFRCPDGHVFERFQKMSDPIPAKCDVCNKGPVETVLHPVPVHYKGSGFYSTDYGRGRKVKDSGGGDSGSGSGSSDSSGSAGSDSGSKSESKAAASD
jgi:putative FmdB family regulatory protein